MRGWSAQDNVCEQPDAGLSSLSLLLPGCSRWPAGRMAAGWEAVGQGVSADSSRGCVGCLERRAEESCRLEDKLIARGPPKAVELSVGRDNSRTGFAFRFPKWCEGTEIIVCFISGLHVGQSCCLWQCLCV